MTSILHSQSASGTGLAFIVFTEAVIEMPGSQVWAVLLFVMLFSLGLSSTFGSIEPILTPLCDLNLVSKWIPNELVTGVQHILPQNLEEYPIDLGSHVVIPRASGFWKVFENNV